jgi:hypothetical protein
MVPSWLVRMDSGWNWTSSVGCLVCRIPIRSPSGVRAVTVRQAGSVSSSTRSEW